jgi:hypothetical protein
MDNCSIDWLAIVISIQLAMLLAVAAALMIIKVLEKRE